MQKPFVNFFEIFNILILASTFLIYNFKKVYMTSITQSFSQIDKKDFKLPQKIPVLYLWFGKSVPEDYLISLSELNYPVIFLKNPQIPRQFKRDILDIQKSDYYRLQYLYDHGGIYSDFDNIIDYPCLMRIIQPYRNKDLLVFMTDQRHTRAKTAQMTTNLIFAPYPKMPILKKMLDSIDQTKKKVWDFSGMKFVGRFTEPVEVSMKQCVKHTYDWSWFEASNQVLGKKSEAHKIYAKKLLKKSQIVNQKNKLQKQLQRVKQIKRKLEYQSNKIHNENTQLKTDLKKIQFALSKKCPSKAVQTSISPQQKSQIKKNSQTINALKEINTKLQFQRDMYILQICGGMIIFLLMIVAAFFLIKLRRRKQFRKIENQQKQSIAEQ